MNPKQTQTNLDKALETVFKHLETVPDGKIAIEILKRFLGA